MKRILVMGLMAVTLSTYSQKTNLVTVNTVRPKKGQKMAFEAAYKLHVAKFHKAAGQKVNVFEILTGPNAGCFHLNEGDLSFADFDKTRPDAAAHSLDLDKTFFPLLEETMNGTYRWMDSLSFHSDVKAEPFVVTVRHLKPGLEQNDYRKELARAVKINSKLKGNFIENLSTSYYEQLWDGSDQVVVQIRNLKDGFKSLEDGYYGLPQPGNAFRDAYVAAYGHAAWDARVKILDGAIESNTQYLAKWRKDISSQ